MNIIFIELVELLEQVEMDGKRNVILSLLLYILILLYKFIFSIKKRSVTLTGEADRKLLKMVIKHSQKEQIKKRNIDVELIKEYDKKLEDIKQKVKEVLKEEKEEKLVKQTEMELLKSQNLLRYENEILSRPARTWFQTEKEKQLSKNLSIKGYNEKFDVKKRRRDEDDDNVKGGERKKIKRDKYAGMSRSKKRRMKLREDDDSNNHKKIESLKAIRLAKKAQRPTKINKIIEKDEKKEKRKHGGGKKNKNNEVGFKMDLADASKKKAFSVVPKKKDVGKEKSKSGNVIKKKVKSRGIVKKNGKNVKNVKRRN